MRHAALRLALAFVVATVGCSSGSQTQTTFSGSTMGTTYNVTIVGDAASVAPRVQEVLDSVNDSMSTYKATSELSRFNQATAADWFPVSPELATVVAEALRIAEITHGAFDPTVGPLVDAWGFGPIKTDAPPDVATLDAARALVDYRLVAVDTERNALRKKEDGVRLDLSAIAKGFAVDQIHDMLRANGYRNFLIEVGGEVRAAGTSGSGRAWRIGIDAPSPGPRTAGGHQVAISIADQAVATSGDYRNFRIVDGTRLSHTIDPRSGRPIAHALASVTVVAKTCMLADAVATAVNVLGPEQGWGLLKNRFTECTGYIILHDKGDRFVEKMERRFEKMLLKP
ncbi:MAG: FAD:protein FMN transferase [Planctomycetota bacterium]